MQNRGIVDASEEEPRASTVCANVINDGQRAAGDRHSFEWWYFDFDVSATLRIYLEWHSPMFGLRDASCTLIIRIHDRTNPEAFRSGRGKSRLITKAFRYPRSAVKQSPTIATSSFPPAAYSKATVIIILP